jgi:hypothetical protein
MASVDHTGPEAEPGERGEPDAGVARAAAEMTQGRLPGRPAHDVRSETCL